MAGRDDSFMDRFDRDDLRRYRARDAVIALALTALLLVLFAGDAVRDGAERLPSGVGREAIEVVGAPTGWVADSLPLSEAKSQLTASLSPDADLLGSGFAGGSASAASPDATAGGIPPVTPQAFDPAALGLEPVAELELETMLVTGDSMSQPLDSELARRLAPEGVEVVREPYLGSGISDTDIVDWGKVSVTQAAEHEPDAVVVFIGAGDGYPMPGPDGEPVECCGPEWAAIYANRARQMMDTYRRGAAARVYWMTIPTPRNPERAEITQVVNAAIEVAAQPWRSEIRVVDLVEALTPDDAYRNAIEVDGAERIVRASDGLHLSEAGASVAADRVMELVDRDFVR